MTRFGTLTNLNKDLGGHVFVVFFFAFVFLSFRLVLADKTLIVIVINFFSSMTY